MPPWAAESNSMDTMGLNACGICIKGGAMLRATALQAAEGVEIWVNGNHTRLPRDRGAEGVRHVLPQAAKSNARRGLVMMQDAIRVKGDRVRLPRDGEAEGGCHGLPRAMYAGDW